MTRSTTVVAECKTATIVSANQLAVNAGSAAGVEIGDLVTVRRTIEVKDPDTNARLGVVHLTRLRLRVSVVQESFSVAAVIDEAPKSAVSGILEVTRINKLKRIVARESEADSGAVYIVPGEPVLITRHVDVDDDQDGN